MFIFKHDAKKKINKKIKKTANHTAAISHKHCMMRGCARSRNSTVSAKACLVARDTINIKESRLFMYILNNSDILFGSLP